MTIIGAVTVTEVIYRLLPCLVNLVCFTISSDSSSSSSSGSSTFRKMRMNLPG